MTRDELTIEEFVRQHDLEWYCRDRSLTAASQEWISAGGRPISRTGFSRAVNKNCKWFRQRRRRPYLRRTDLTEPQWRRLKQAVTEMLPELQGVPLSWATEMVRAKATCNARLLCGLPRRLQVWDEKR